MAGSFKYVREWPPSLPLSLKCLVANESACRFYETSGWGIVQRSKDAEGDFIRYRLTKR